MVTGTEAELCTTVDRGAAECLLDEYQIKCALYLDYFHRFTLSSDSPLRWGIDTTIYTLFKATRPHSFYKNVNFIRIFSHLNW